MQAKLLRVLQEREFEPLGSNRTVRVDVRVVAATNRDLEAAVRAGRFRSDLYYRLSVFPLQVPALRERAVDIPLLVTYLVERFARKIGRRIDSVARETMDRLVHYAWPGNVRELQNVLERAVIMSPGPMLVLDDGLLVRASTTAASPVGDAEATGPGAGASIAERKSLRDVARAHIVQTLARTNGVIDGPRGAAQLLNVRPSTLRSRMRKLGIR
jgi:formate hydrogenlyase transcriptional activator